MVRMPGVGTGDGAGVVVELGRGLPGDGLGGRAGRHDVVGGVDDLRDDGDRLGHPTVVADPGPRVDRVEVGGGEERPVNPYRIGDDHVDVTHDPAPDVV